MQVDNITFGAKISNIPYMPKTAGKKLALRDAKLGSYTAFIGSKVYTPEGKIVKQDLLFDGKKIIAIDDFDENTIGKKIDYIILNNETIAPAIVDEHIHG